MADTIQSAAGGGSPSILSIRALEKSFGSLAVLKDISLSVDRGNVISIIGPSGSGKSTLLRCASFLERADGGDILYDGQYAVKDGVYAPKAELNRFRTRFGLVFQNFQLFPHYSVMKNICEAPILHGEDKEAVRERALELIKKMGLEGKENAYPFQLSGGQQQ
ncbi:MAG: amino acid ABC transporter ATP-binding protein, partial [Oscillospiraceae bacterium]|nr:amino acid ABC transporter ATP-binding protein [Oscillospiraceae bacterium]